MTPVPEKVPAQLVDTTMIAPVPMAQALAPTNLAIPALDLKLPVVPMTWVVTTVNGARTTKWIVPDDALGWHVNSAGAGAAGTTILSGHQVQGDALLAPLALGEVEEGQEVVLTDEDGVAFVYRVSAVSAPIPLVGPTEEESAMVDSYLADVTSGRLVLITGWPDFATTHRVFAVAEYAGVAK